MSNILKLLISAGLALGAAQAAKPAPVPAPKPQAIPFKFEPVNYATLAEYERKRCDGLVEEYRIIEKRKQLGGGREWEVEKMLAKQKKIDGDYDRYCLKGRQPIDPATVTATPPAQAGAK
ncbi:hypothetical protein [Chitinimonas lacunae]|uniref:Uncharacterized protein n=1 Tax=Chitinimonas lacunae TaxID=1963018 RepID=A0ABV8MMM2_9NEIS